MANITKNAYITPQNIFQHQITQDSFRQSTRTLHNCPYCCCKVNNTLYTFNDTQHNDNNFMSVAPNRTFPSSFAATFPQFPRLNNFTFSYFNPPFQRYHSAQSRFSTRKFKNEHFPYLSRMDQLQASSVVHCSKQEATQIAAETPKKHKILKTIKGIQQKSEASEVLNKIMNIPLQHYENEEERMPLAINSEDLKATPVQHLKNIIQPLNNSTIMPQSILDQESLKSEVIIIQGVKNYPQNELKYPTIDSIHIFQQKSNHIQYLVKESSSNLTSIKLIDRLASRQSKKRIPVENQQQLLASRLAEQLQLNYDYFYPCDKTDRSLSMEISL